MNFNNRQPVHRALLVRSTRGGLEASIEPHRPPAASSSACGPSGPQYVRPEHPPTRRWTVPGGPETSMTRSLLCGTEVLDPRKWVDFYRSTHFGMGHDSVFRILHRVRPGITYPCAASA